MKIDLNCDLGEGEPSGHTRALMQWITSANVACGGHAGTEDSMRECVRLARDFRVNLGAHPGPPSRTDRGRGPFVITEDELAGLLLGQVAPLAEMAATEGTTLHHIKLHGSLYHAVEQNADLARAYVRLVKQHWRDLRIIAFAGGQVVRAAAEQAIAVWGEAFADRAYQKDGQLLPRSQPNAVFHDVGAVVERVRRLTAGAGLSSHCGATLDIRCDTVCVHSDSPGALEIVREVSCLLQEN